MPWQLPLADKLYSTHLAFRYHKASESSVLHYGPTSHELSKLSGYTAQYISELSGHTAQHIPELSRRSLSSDSLTLQWSPAAPASSTGSSGKPLWILGHLCCYQRLFSAHATETKKSILCAPVRGDAKSRRKGVVSCNSETPKETRGPNNNLQLHFRECTFGWRQRIPVWRPGLPASEFVPFFQNQPPEVHECFQSTVHMRSV